MKKMKSRSIRFEPRPFGARLWLTHVRHSFSTFYVMEGLMRFKRFLNRLAVCLVSAVALPIIAVAAIGIMLTVYPYVAGETRISELLALDECTRSIEVHDANGWIGTVPTSLYPRPSHCQQYKDSGWGDHVTAYVSDPPDAWWEMLVALENERLGSWYKLAIRGLDLLSLAKVFLDGIWHGQPDRGASTIHMQIVRSLLALSPRSTETLREKLRRKFTELRDSPLLYAALGGANSLELRRWAARHLPCAQGTSSSKIGSIYGIGNCSQILFSKPYTAISVPEQAVLAASVKTHVLIAPSNDEHGRQIAHKRWKRIVKRALLALDRWGSQDDPALEAAKATVRAMKMPTPMLAHDFSQLLPKDPAERVATIANPMRRAANFLTGDLIQALGEIKDLYGEVPSNLVGLELTVNGLRNSAFKHRVEEKLKTEQEKHPDRFLLPLPPSSHKTLPTADVTLSLVNSAGHVVRHYSSGHDSIWSGPHAKRLNGRYLPQAENRTIGSLSKTVAALLLASRFRPSDLLCDRFFRGLTNHDGSIGYTDCQSSSSQISVVEAFAKSRNLPIAMGLERFQDDAIASAVTRSGLMLQKNTPPRTAVAFGMVTATPRSLIRLMTAVNRGARHEPARAVLPTLIKTISLLQEDGSIQEFSFDTVRDHGQIDISPFFLKQRAPQFIARVLAAPSQAQAGGTLGGLDQIVRDLGGHQLLVKTGTTIVKHGRDTKIRDQLVLGSFRDHTGELMSFHLLIGSPHPKHAFSDRGGLPKSGKLLLIKALLES